LTPSLTWLAAHPCLPRLARCGQAARSPLRSTLGFLREARNRMSDVAAEQRRQVPALAPRIALRITDSPIADSWRLAGEGAIGQVVDDLDQLRLPGADTVVLDPFNGDPALGSQARRLRAGAPGGTRAVR
jgi:hypothetical protein